MVTSTLLLPKHSPVYQEMSEYCKLLLILQQEEAVKREADSILGEVRQKQNEAQRMLQLVEALTVLRQTRATKAAAQGQPKDTQAEERFTTTTGKIAILTEVYIIVYCCIPD